MESDLAGTIARVALDIHAIKLNPDSPFQWASGYRMPIYNDNRMLLGSAENRDLVKVAFLGAIEDAYGINPLVNAAGLVIAGTSTAGIPWAEGISTMTRGPMIYIRERPKDHGMRNQIEGIDAESDLGGREVVVIEDLISTGGSSASAVQAVRDAKGSCDNCISIFNYGFDEAAEMFAGKRPYNKEGTKTLNPACSVRSILTYDTLLRVARNKGYVTADQVKMLEEWRADPFGWGEKRGFPRVVKDKR
jgi:orotate phosphoribosyltransferase